jgi:O-succinylhomoserine sulfhydrylase
VGGAVVANESLGTEVLGFLRTAGPCMSPFNAWVHMKGLETLRVRMLAHSDNAQQLALWLEQQPLAEKVYYAGLESHPQHQLARRQQQGFGGLLAFTVPGDQAAAWAFINATQLVSITANLGDTKSTITHPATTTHGRLTPEQRAEAGIVDGLVRVAVGLEDVVDLKADLQRGFDKIGLRT